MFRNRNRFAVVLSRHVALQAPGESADCTHPVLRQRESPSPSGVFGLGTLDFPLESAFMWTCYFGVSRFADSLRPAELLAPLAGLTGHFPPSQQGFYVRAFGRGHPPRRRIYLRWHLGTSTDRTFTC
jgi:hypothetical protein